MLQKKLTILRDVQSILKDYKENSVKLLQCIQELQFCYQMLLLRYTNDSPCTDIIFRDVLLFDVGSGWYQLAKVKMGNDSFTNSLYMFIFFFARPTFAELELKVPV